MLATWSRSTVLGVLVALLLTGGPSVNPGFTDTVPELVPDDRQSVTFAFNPRSPIRLTGSSTVTDWSCESSRAGGFIHLPIPESDYKQAYQLVTNGEIDRGRAILLDAVRTRARAMIWFPIRAFQCDSQGMTEDMYEALKVSKQKIILFQYYGVNDVRIQQESGSQAIRIQLDLSGAIALAGVGKTVKTTVTISPKDPNTYRISGHLRVRMSQFNIQRPTALFGLIKAYDPVTVHFQLGTQKINSLRESKSFVRQNLAEYLRLVRSDTETKTLSLSKYPSEFNE